MSNKVKLLDCTLRDGAYITNSFFGDPAIRGIIDKSQAARMDIIECGWLKDKPHEAGSSFYHVPEDIEPYLPDKKPEILYVTMIDWDRYDLNNLPEYSGKSIDAIRVVFPHGRHREGIEVGRKIRDKGYKVMFQAANTLAYSDDDLVDLAECMNAFKPVALSVVDTFGAMMFDDLRRIIDILDSKLDKSIQLGFHAHNNQQLAFALCISFIERMAQKDRGIIVDATLNGMGRGAGNATTELVASFLNRKMHCDYDMNAIMDAIDIYMQGFHEKYTWGYSTPYFIAGMYQCHVNNIAYLLKNHRTNARDMRNIIESLSPEDRRKYDYDLLENKFIENQSRIVDDSAVIQALKAKLAGRKVLLLAPGKSVDTQAQKIREFIARENPVVVAINAINKSFACDYLFFINSARYEYARTVYPDVFFATKRILLSNIKTQPDPMEVIVNFNTLIKRGWEHFDNAVITFLRLLDKLEVRDVYIAGFDGFKTKYNESYADESLPTLNPDNKWDELNEEILEMYADFRESTRNHMNVCFVTESIFASKN